MEHAKREAEHGERFLEFRLDYLPDPKSGLPLIQEFLAAIRMRRFWLPAGGIRIMGGSMAASRNRLQF